MKKYLVDSIEIIQKLNVILSNKQKVGAIGLLGMTIIGSIFEMLSISIVTPLIATVLHQETDSAFLNIVLKMFGANNMVSVVICLVIFIYVLKNITLTGVSYYRAKYATCVQRELSVTLMRAYLQRGYSFFIETRTADLLRGIGGDVNGVYAVINNLLRLISNVGSIVLIVIMVVWNNVSLTGVLIVFAIVGVAIPILGFGKKMKSWGNAYRINNGLIGKYSLEAFGGAKEILVSRREKFFVKHYDKAYRDAQSSVVRQMVVSDCSTYLIETIIVLGAAFFAVVYISTENDIVSLIPQLSMIAMAVLKIYPKLGDSASCINQVIYNKAALYATYENYCSVNKISYEDLYEENNRYEEANFIDKIEVKDISFRYKADGKAVLEHLSLEIECGQSVAIVGQSGAGKTTFADIFLGLLKPQNGDILIDGESIYSKAMWSRMIGYVPQNIFLTEDTIRNNVAFGIEPEDISDEQVWHALEQAQLSDFVNSQREKLDAMVGERGIKISGGQRQRIAIARALYYDPPIIVLDEATSALDGQTEQEVMNAINRLKGSKTMIIIAHRLSTIEKCDHVYEICDGKAYKKR